ncbi:MAG: hypothetical protein H0V97_13095 [Actinobacteria bacterium]|nr:hypothetical protein [Actinomycetota bacterium]
MRSAAVAVTYGTIREEVARGRTEDLRHEGERARRYPRPPRRSRRASRLIHTAVHLIAGDW